MEARVVALLPNAGLANKLFVWARAQIFGRLNGMEVHTIGWGWPKIGPMLRREKSPRMYARHFKRTSVGAGAWLMIGWLSSAIRREPPCCLLTPAERKVVYLFYRVPHWGDYFADIRDHRDFLRDTLLAALRAEDKSALNTLPAPVVALHVRCGDFRVLRPDEDFRKLGGVRTPLDYFCTLVDDLREAAGFDVPITVFSDGTDVELAPLLKLPEVARSTTPNDVVDLLLMSRAAVIVSSAGSTFSDWAGFLSEAVLLRHPDHIHSPIRPDDMRRRLYEGPPPASGEAWREIWRGSIEPIISARALRA